MQSIGIKGMGYYVPENVFTNFDFEKIIDTSDEWIRTRTGIIERRFASKDQATSDLATEASLKAIKNAKISKEDVDMIILATTTADYIAQGAACIVQNKLGLKKIPCFDLNAACTGFIYGLEVAYSLVKSGLYKNILVIGAETLSRIIDMQNRNTCVLFGDGAAAAIVGEVEKGYGFLGFSIGAEGEDNMILKVPAGGSKKPNNEETIKNRENFVIMKGQDVFKFAVSTLPKVTSDALEKAKLKVNDLSMVFPHQANLRIIESAAKRMKFPLEKFYMNLSRYGNTSSASVGIALGEAIEKGLVKKGDNIALTGFGGGLTYGSTIIKWAY
ncbi:ketoacyl-ACP synthase III [Fusobacterium nucleatum subsp. nucleatum ATCC 23726]|uniref:Beta-ketoacyl-[acyl-carrier-protein] synthase III n=1 Tax=Fusobacterium nucleatum subsp. nucleatum (strain ATCC 23726 / VPI 4351) TaxID=525283 RepID=D5RC77_FUSN2|nr:beta-ketoacyl-ACP synthase III [Fusobacterium nucleatum]ALF23611.1 3-oxoacyl-ACP synthase [Fusobacterium nucleatum subsp. nucleatum ChDC F316]ASG27023.1 3-oxoacyl-ACP synthase III [Fusobacterium nucleatum subsp. nucleatum]AVQ22856.1 3-oxoacyl-ACP synthase III [Fusobacterium nucleatum subsp. nucleatum ATCC 23726]EFG95644.1 3-oxoacyl-(acyl carrier protein) synthase III [Fusobacterium nucleatum subsp. nucleatum ATCC 23726]ERT43446.1 3-oxoacyl-[acyl-carrier-protein] synthase 3 [Fusobacterium nu